MTDRPSERGAGSPLDDLRCIACGGAKEKMIMLNVKELESSEYPSIFLAYAMCHACNQEECGARVLAAMKAIVDAASRVSSVTGYDVH